MCNAAAHPREGTALLAPPTSSAASPITSCGGSCLRLWHVKTDDPLPARCWYGNRVGHGGLPTGGRLMNGVPPVLALRPYPIPNPTPLPLNSYTTAQIRSYSPIKHLYRRPNHWPLMPQPHRPDYRNIIVPIFPSRALCPVQDLTSRPKYHRRSSAILTNRTPGKREISFPIWTDRAPRALKNVVVRSALTSASKARDIVYRFTIRNDQQK